MPNSHVILKYWINSRAFPNHTLVRRAQHTFLSIHDIFLTPNPTEVRIMTKDSRTSLSGKRLPHLAIFQKYIELPIIYIYCYTQ